MKDAANCLILGAAGRDFHDFLVFFRRRPQYRVRAFTATQIPFIENRMFPAVLAGPEYPDGIPIYPETELPNLIRSLDIDYVFLAYSDLSHVEVMHKASLVQGCGASFVLLGPRHTQLDATKPVVAVTAVRTGAGKSPLSQWIARELAARGRRPAVLRHPMPYGDLARQAVQRIASAADLNRFSCTVEEREEYEPYLEQGMVVFAGVDYAALLAQAEQEADVLVWDGGNNDFPFLRPSVWITVVDALRPGHEERFYPGETNLRAAQIIVLNKVGGADVATLASLRERIARYNPTAALVESDLSIQVDHSEALRGRRVLVVEDGPTLTHGGMSHGAGWLAVQQIDVRELVDPRPFAIGSIADAYRRYPHIGPVLPALGYSPQQCGELSATIEASGADVVLDASPCRLDRLLKLTRPMVRVRYFFQQVAGPPLMSLIEKRL